MDSKNTPRVWPIRQRKPDTGVVERDPWATKPKAVAETVVRPLIPGQTSAANAADSMAAALEDAWHAYGEVVDVIGAITNATRLVGRGIAAESQKATIDLLSDDLAMAWSRWDSAHRRILGPAPEPLGTD
jgi:hypothetical protein